MPIRPACLCRRIVGTSWSLCTCSVILFAVRTSQPKRTQNNGPLRPGNELIRASSLPENRMKFTRELRSNTHIAFNGIRARYRYADSRVALSSLCRISPRWRCTENGAKGPEYLPNICWPPNRKLFKRMQQIAIHSVCSPVADDACPSIDLAKRASSFRVSLTIARP